MGSDAANTSGVYIASAHTEVDQALHLYASDDGKAWREVPLADRYPDRRDNSIMRHNGRWYTAFTGLACFYIAASDDLVSWPIVNRVELGAPYTGYTWAPEWFRDRDGTIRVYISASRVGTTANSLDMGLFEMHPTTDDLTGPWSVPVELTVTGAAASAIDPFMILLDDGRYAFWYKREDDHGARWISWALGDSPLGPFTEVADNVFTVSNREGICLVRIGQRSWRAYYNVVLTDGVYWRESHDDFATWTAETAVTGGTFSHCTVIHTTEARI